MNKYLPVNECGVAYALSIVGGKWKLFLLWKLIDGPKRYSDLRRTLPGISEPVLITQLKELQQSGLVKRIDYGTIPPRVEYALTSQGRGLHTALAELERWGLKQRAEKLLT